MRALTKSDKERGQKLIDLGCVICIAMMGLHSPPEIHHIDGKTKKGCHKKTIGLCPNHHRFKSNDKPPKWVSRHGDGRVAFEEKYGTEQELLERTNRMICED